MRLVALIGVLVAASLFVGSAGVRADEPVVQAVFFWSETCPHCHEVMEEVLPPLEEEYGAQLEIAKLELSEVPKNYEVWIAAVEAFQVAPERRAVPMLFIGDTVLVGSGEIPERLPGLIEQHLAAGGVDYPDVPGLEDVLEETAPPQEDPAPQPTPRPTPTIKACHECDDNVVVGTASAVVNVLFFYDRLCEECGAVEEEVIAPLQETYGAQLVVDQRDVEGSTDNYNLLRSLEKRHGVTHAEMPVIFVGEYVLTGEQEARDRLPELVEMYRTMGGVALPEIPPTPTSEATTSPEKADKPPIHLAYFYQPGCQECDRIQLALNYLRDQYPQLNVCSLNVREQAPLAEWLGEQAEVPVGKRLTAPAVFVGDDALVGEELHTGSLEALLARYADSGTKRICTGWEAASEETVSGIIERFRSFSLPTVLVAGLVDGLNPCAFATLVFFISYLTFMGREGREVLLAGGAFAAAVFLTYLGVGFGVLKFLASLPFLDAVSRWIYGFTAVLCLALAVGSFYDWWQARRGKAKDMRLAMPTRLRRRVNQAIRERAGAKAFVPVTFVTGVVVSVIELACTGQVYLPTILFVLGVPEMQAQAGFYLVLYNLMFILPLVVVFVLAYFGTTSQQLGLLIHRHTAKVKLATAALFLLLAGWMVVTLV
jgi:cytochrome c biogenesis protein CcdA/glutaredoxin